MATADARSETRDVFQTVERQIREAFDDLIVRITTRRDGFLEEIRKLKLAFQEKIKSQEKTLEELENIRIQLQNVSQKENTTSNILQSTLAPIDKQLSDLRASLIQPPNLHFSCQTHRISEMIGNLGKLDYEGKLIDYTNKCRAVHLMELVFKVDGFHIDHTDLYVLANSNILLYDTTNWELVRTYNLKNININAIATSRDHFYVLNTRNEILKLTKEEFQLLKSQTATGGTKTKSCEFTSISVASEDDIFVVDRGNNRICMFDSNLYFRREFGTETLKGPSLVKIEGNRVIVKDDSKDLHLFNKHGDYLRDLSEYGDIGGWFCFDRADNIILSSNDSVRIISSKGEMLKKIGREVKGCEDVKGCGPIALFKDKIIVACRATSCIKIL